MVYREPQIKLDKQTKGPLPEIPAGGLFNEKSGSRKMKLNEKEDPRTIRYGDRV